MGGFSIYHWLVVALVILIFFGRGKISETMGDFGRGIRSFRKGMSEIDEDKPKGPPPAQLPPQQPEASSAPSEDKVREEK